MKTIAEINQRITSGEAVVLTADEVVEFAQKKGVEAVAREVDVVTTATFGAMCSSGAFLNFGHADPPIRMTQILLNDVPAYGGLAAVDTYIGATEISQSEGMKYGGAHVIEDLVAGRRIKLVASSPGTDCYPRRNITTYLTLDSLNQAYLYNPRNAYQNYSCAVNTSEKIIHTYMGTLLPRMGNATYSTSGQLSPLLNDPYYRTIGMGTRIFLGGGIGYVAWEGTQHNPLAQRTENGVPTGGAGTLAVMGNLRGIDISHHQGSPDFKRIRAAGIKFVILKATEGVNYTDPCFHTNIKAALAAGLPAGAYHFLRATPLDRQISDFLAAIKPYKLICLAIDVENPSAGSMEISGLGKTGITDRIITIYKAIRAAGYTCPVYVYSSKSWFGTYIDTARCKAAGLRIWLAWYTNATPASTDRSSLCDIWQYCSDGRVDGIAGNVDCNVAYRDFGAAKPAAEAQQTAVRVDTTGTVKLPHGGVYQLKTTCPQQPGVTSARPDIVKVLHRARLGEDDFWYLVAVGGRPGDGVGIYTAAPGEQGQRRMIVEIK